MPNLQLASHEPEHIGSAPHPLELWNYVSGSVLSPYDAVSHRYEILTTDGGLIHAIDDDADSLDLKVRQPVTVKIATDDVLVAPDGFSALPKWNQWTARIVLVEPGSHGGRVTAKIIGEPWTLTSTMSLLPIRRDLRAWDVVTLLIDPTRIILMGGGSRKSRLRRRLLTYINQSAHPLHRTMFAFPAD
jgi:hypothetical protein